MSSCSSVVTINVGHVYSAPTPGASGKFANSEKLPGPSVWVQVQGVPRPVECPRSRHHHLGELSTIFN